MKSSYQFFLFFYLFILVNYSYGQIIKPDAILINEYIIISYDEKGNITEEISRRYKIENENGEDLARFIEYYDDQISISDLKFIFYNSKHEKIKNDHVYNIEDKNVNEGAGSFTDNRVMYSTVDIHSFPYYADYRYKKKYIGNLMLSMWFPQSNSHLEVVHAGLLINVHNSIEMKYKAFNLKEEQVNQLSNDYKSYSFSVDSVKAFSYEAFSPPMYERYPVLYFTPINFNYDGSSGSFSSWETFGDWILNLNKGHDDLSEASIDKLHALVEGISDTIAIVKKVYQYMQDNTRYVSVQFGIGGYQPFFASEVDEKGFGDCKALSFYTHSLLKQLGIKSNYTLVRAGYNIQDIDFDFPSIQFNHVILNVPLKNDTIWLECTSQDYPFAYLGDFTSNRHALSIGDEIAIVKTPDYSKQNNFQLNVSEFLISEDGKAKASISTFKQGVLFDDFDNIFFDDKSKQEKWIYTNSELNDIEIEHFEITYGGDRIPYANLNYQCLANSFAKISGKRMFIPLKSQSKFERIPIHDSNRIYDIVLKNTLTIIDSIIFVLPPNYTIEYIPDSKNIESEFGTLSTILSVDSDKIIYKQKLEVEKGRFSSNKYDEFVMFYNELIKSENIVLKKSEE